MKYKDFKMLSNDDMKQIVGGYAPLDCSHNCPSGQSAQGCTGCDSCTDVKDGNGNVIGLERCVGSLCVTSNCGGAA